MSEFIRLETSTIVKPNGKKYTYWTLRWTDSAGKRHCQSLGSKKKTSWREAKLKLKEKELEFAKRPGRRDVSGSPGLADFLKDYYRARKSDLAKGTLDLHEHTGRYLLEYFGVNKRLDTIHKRDARAFRTALATGELAHVNKRKRKEEDGPLSPASVDIQLRNAHTIFNLALADDLIANNPFGQLTTTRPSPRAWHYVSLAEFRKISEAAPPQVKVLLALCRLAALRRGEALHLRWGSVDWNSQRLTVIADKGWQPKDKEPRTVPICSELSRILLAAFESAETRAENVIPVGSISIKNLSRDFTVLCKRAGITRYSKPFHTLRKSCLTDWAARFPMHVVREWAGHSDIDTTNRFYLKVGEAYYQAGAAFDFDESHKLLHKLPGSEDGNCHKSLAGEEIRTPDVQLGKLAFYH